MKRLHCTRAQAFLLAILLLGTFGGLAFFYGDKLGSNALQLITTIVMLIGGIVKSADGFFYDGTPAKPEQSTSTIETKETP
jgi:hypothetical protein